MREGWINKKLGDVCQVVTGSTPKTNISEYWDGNYPWVTPAELKGDVYISDTVRHITEKAIAHTNLTLLPIGTVLLSSRAPIGKVAITTIEMYCNQGFKNLICSDAINNKYLYLWLSGKTEYLNSLGRGATFKEISKTIVENVIIPLPPLSIQKSIVSELDKISELIRLKKEQLSDYDKLAQSLFNEMFGDPHYNEKGWDEVIVGDVCATKAQILRASKKFGSTDEIQYIDISSIDNLAHEMTNCTTYTMSDAPSRAQQCVIKGDIVISTVRPNLKNIAIVSNDDENLVASSGFCILRPNKIDRNFLFHYILSEYYTEYLVSLTTGANYPAVRDSDILKSKIYYPPISIQQFFAQRIELIEQQKAEIQNTIADLETLLASRMQYWFD